MRYQRCTYFKEGNCFNMGERNGLNTLPCAGYDRCESYEVEVSPVTKDKGQMPSRIDIVGSNGNEGSHYLVEKVARAICGEAYANQVMAGDMAGRKRWEVHIAAALRVIEVMEDD